MTDFDIDARNDAVRRAHGIGIEVLGLRELQRSMKQIDPEVRKEFRKELRAAGKPILADARANAPFRANRLARAGATPLPPHLRDTLRLSVTQTGVAFGSRLPQSNLIHWGGSTGKGHRVGVRWSGASKVRESLFLSNAVEKHEEDAMEAMDRAVENAARRAGWE